jgi:hypothetical protein
MELTRAEAEAGSLITNKPQNDKPCAHHNIAEYFFAFELTSMASHGRTLKTTQCQGGADEGGASGTMA